MKVVVLGARGQLGAAVVQEYAGHAEVVGLTRADVDVTNRSAVETRVAAEAPDLLINCAAYNQVDAAEDEPAVAFAANALAVATLARAAADAGAVFVHYSTDFVFDGQGSRPYDEGDPANPKSVYGVSKLVGEWLAVDAPRHYVLRVESLFGQVAGGPSRGSAAAICSRVRADEEVEVFVDRTVTPTYIVDAAVATRAIAAGNLPFGTYHCVSSGTCTWKEFAEEAARVLGRVPKLKLVTLESKALRAPRPKYCALSNERLAGLGVRLPSWQDALRRSLTAEG
jgi:dTDP-4-dehydrorhamnose reductase